VALRSSQRKEPAFPLASLDDWTASETLGGFVVQKQEGSTVINLIIALIVGGVIGWLASIVMRTDAQQGVLLNIVVGIVGSILGSFLLGRLFGAEGNILNSPLSIPTILAALVGSIILLAIVNLFRRGRVR